MKKNFIIANWKSHFTHSDIIQWFEHIASESNTNLFANVTVVICPSYPYLSLVTSLIAQYHLPFFVGAQDVSLYEGGAYTGEVSGMQLKDFAQYVLVGHYERRHYFHESEEVVSQKIRLAHSATLKTIYCIDTQITQLPEHVTIVAYEPVAAIGGDRPDSLSTISKIAQTTKALGCTIFCYGGSVSKDTIHDILACLCVDGVLVGKESLKADSFIQLIKNA